MDDWVFDSVMGYLQSPQWTTPVLTFIDENCVVFDNEEENKLIYTEIHQVFVVFRISIDRRRNSNSL